MVFYKDLNERFISENPTNTVSERSSSLGTSSSAFIQLGQGPSRQGQGTLLRQCTLGCPALPCPLQPFYLGPTLKRSQALHPWAACISAGDDAGGRERSHCIWQHSWQTLGAPA